MIDQVRIAEIFEKFPECRTNGIVTRKQILEATGKCYVPSWAARYKHGRGTYLFSVDGNAARTVTEVPTEVPVQEPTRAMTTDINTFVPMKDPNFVSFGEFRNVESVVKSGMFYPTYITGPTGNGKSTMVEQICAKHQRPLIRINLNMMSDEDQLIGTKTLQDGNIEIVEGPVLVAMRTGSILLLDEIDAGAPNTLLCLQPILEGKSYYFKLKNEVIVPAPGFNIIATANTKGKGNDDGKYIGTNILNEAFLERFAVTFEQSYPSVKAETKIANLMMGSLGLNDEAFVDLIIKWAHVIRKSFNDGAIDENITTRRLIHIIKAFAVFGERRKAVEVCCNRFDEHTKEAFMEVFDSCTPEEVKEEAKEEAEGEAKEEVKEEAKELDFLDLNADIEF